jgi:hypothetical protein
LLYDDLLFSGLPKTIYVERCCPADLICLISIYSLRQKENITQ